MNFVHVMDFMVMNPVIIRPECPLIEAAQKMKQNHIGSVIITEDTKPIGILTERDIVWRVVADGKDINLLKVSDIYSTPVITISEDSHIEEAIELMREYGIRRLVVTNCEGVISGILTSDDIVMNIESVSRELALEYLTLSRNIRGFSKSQ
jgi:predicted transcriptional regulator